MVGIRGQNIINLSDDEVEWWFVCLAYMWII